MGERTQNKIEGTFQQSEINPRFLGQQIYISTKTHFSKSTSEESLQTTTKPARKSKAKISKPRIWKRTLI
jgi:hypothetical protein